MNTTTKRTPTNPKGEALKTDKQRADEFLKDVQAGRKMMGDPTKSRHAVTFMVTDDEIPVVHAALRKHRGRL